MFKCNDSDLIKKFYALETSFDVISLLEEDTLNTYDYIQALNKDSYRPFTLKKKNGSFREIHSPEYRLKNIQKKLSYVLTLIYNPKTCTYGFIKEKNILQNAQKHKNKKIIINIDLKDFFHSIHYGRIKGMLINKPYEIGVEASKLISKIASYFLDYNKSILPQGSPCSPIISNMICKSLDNKMLKLASRNGFSYSRYADDITISTNKTSISSEIIYYNKKTNLYEVGSKLSNIIYSSGFEVNENKVFYNNKNTRQEVTGLVVNKFPNIKREYIKDLRAILHNIKSSGIENALIKYNQIYGINKIYTTDSFKESIIGKLNFIKYIRGENDPVFKKYALEFNTIFQYQYFDFIKDNKFDFLYNKVFVLENMEHQGTCFKLNDVGILTNYHVIDQSLTNSKKDRESLEASQCHETNIVINTVNNKLICKFNYDANFNSKESNLFYDKDIDYFNISNNNTKKLKGLDHHSNLTLEIGQKVYIVGYPNYMKGNTINIQETYITGNRAYLGDRLWQVNSVIIHGTSGGPVLNENMKVIGIVKAGNSSNLDNGDTTFMVSGFIHIDLVLNDIHKKKR